MKKAFPIYLEDSKRMKRKRKLKWQHSLFQQQTTLRLLRGRKILKDLKIMTSLLILGIIRRIEVNLFFLKKLIMKKRLIMLILTMIL